ncbi:hypothetical protein [Wansuia hejianensis]|nr:hypothetical protein [Wansuia hejianensis]
MWGNIFDARRTAKRKSLTIIFFAEENDVAQNSPPDIEVSRPAV